MTANKMSDNIALTISQMPVHNHSPHTWGWHVSTGFNTGQYNIPTASGNGNTHTYNAQPNDGSNPRVGGNAGGGAAHENRQPFITTYMWKRVS